MTNNYKPGDKITVNGINLLVLDIIDGNPFVLALNLEEKSVFSNTSNSYIDSKLSKIIDKWCEKANIPMLLRNVDLMAIDGYNYGTLKCCAAPLTFDEYRKYSDIIIPNIIYGFFTCTPWDRPEINSTYVCIVHSDGVVYWDGYNTTRRLAPAFILDINAINAKKKEDMHNISTKELIKELLTRLEEE